jgi:hypothetical protein
MQIANGLAVRDRPDDTWRPIRRIELFAVRCRDLRDQVVDGRMLFIDAVDMAYSAAVWSGLADDLGDDVVQQVMAAAFGTVSSEQRAAARTGPIPHGARPRANITRSASATAMATRPGRVRLWKFSALQM